MSSLSQSHEQLQSEWSRFQHQWQTTASQWNDTARYRFERDFIQAYEPAIAAVLKELAKLDQVIAQAQRAVK